MGLVVDLIMQETLANVDLNDDPILVLSCGHALTMSTLDGMMEINQFYEEEMDPKTGASSFVSKLPLPGSHPLQMGCPHCRKPIMDPLRYGRRIKYAQLAMRLKKHQISQSTAVSSAQKELEEGQLKLTADKTTFLKMLRGVKAGEKNEPPSEKSRKIGRLSQETDQLPELNLFAAMSTYSIPTDQAEKWKAISLGLRRVLVQFRNIHEQAMNSPTRKLFESAVSHLYRSKVLKIEAQQLEDKNLQSSLQDETPASMDGMSSANADVASPEPSSSTATAELVPEYKIEPERITGVDASRIIQECIRECGLPVDGYGGASHLDALQGIVDVLLILVKVVFEILSEDNQGTGWYWYQEDILKATTMVTVMYIEVAQRGNFRLRELTGLVHVMGLIVSQAKLRNLREQDHGDREQKIKDVKDLESQFEVKFRSFVSVYSNVKTPTEEAKLIRQQCHSRAMALELDIKSYVKASRGGTFYTSVSDNEKMEIFKIMSASLRGNGHWYMCPNGHTYVIGECGMAMQESQCPECGARIGGGSHELLQTNSVNLQQQEQPSDVTMANNLWQQTPPHPLPATYRRKRRHSDTHYIASDHVVDMLTRRPNLDSHRDKKVRLSLLLGVALSIPSSSLSPASNESSPSSPNDPIVIEDDEHTVIDISGSAAVIRPIHRHHHDQASSRAGVRLQNKKSVIVIQEESSVEPEVLIKSSSGRRQKTVFQVNSVTPTPERLAHVGNRDAEKGDDEVIELIDLTPPQRESYPEWDTLPRIP
ncbi:hypothetical protein BGW38_005439, partial [Lunasporangiospora selenospora]